MPAVTTLVADKANGPSQHTTRDLRDPNGQGQTIETVLVFQPDGVHLQEIKVTTVLGGGVTDVRDVQANPAPLIARTGATPGDHYDFTLTGSGTTFHGVITIQRLEHLVVGGQAVDTAVAKLDVDFSGSVTGHQSSTIDVALTPCVAVFLAPPPPHAANANAPTATHTTTGPRRALTTSPFLLGRAAEVAGRVSVLARS